MTPRRAPSKPARRTVPRAALTSADRAVRAVVAEAIEPQLIAALDMLERAIRACPPRLWARRSRVQPFWYIAYHTLFFTDLNVLGDERRFAPPAPFGLEELDPAGVMPPRVYTPAELLAYADHCRRAARAACRTITAARARTRIRFSWMAKPYLELQVHNLRHVQHHTAQLYMRLRQAGVDPPGWVFGGKARRG